jgi:hypothetical protein
MDQRGCGLNTSPAMTQPRVTVRCGLPGYVQVRDALSIIQKSPIGWRVAATGDHSGRDSHPHP